MMETKKEDLKVELGSDLEVLWTRVLDGAEKVIKQAENEILVQKELEIIAKAKIAEEKAKIKKA